jgi:hypothetical protein
METSTASFGFPVQSHQMSRLLKGLVPGEFMVEVENHVVNDLRDFKENQSKQDQLYPNFGIA